MFPGSMKLVLVCLVICLAWTNAQSPTDQTAALEAWEEFVKTYEKTYATEEEYQLRKEQFLKNYESLESEKKVSSGVSHKVGVTKFSDLSQDEFLKGFTGLVMDDESDQKNKSRLPPRRNKAVSAPLNFDWRTVSNIVSPIRNQGQCGSCWAFATIATVESIYNKRYPTNTRTFSEQHLVDCNLSNHGCDGGNPTLALNYLLANGTATLPSYPYTAVRGACRSTLQTGIYRKFLAYYYYNAGDSILQNLLVNYGPLTVVIDATPLQTYRGGILNVACRSMNHAVNIVGYVTSGPGAPYYILRNSWGTNWGERGYFRVSAVNSCFIKTHIWFGTY